MTVSAWRQKGELTGKVRARGTTRQGGTPYNSVRQGIEEANSAPVGGSTAKGRVGEFDRRAGERRRELGGVEAPEQNGVADTVGGAGLVPQPCTEAAESQFFVGGILRFPARKRMLLQQGGAAARVSRGLVVDLNVLPGVLIVRFSSLAPRPTTGEATPCSNVALIA